MTGSLNFTKAHIFFTLIDIMEIPLLPDITIILGLSVLVIYLFQRLNLPTILGFLMTGIVAGPHGLSLIEASHEVEVLSEIGVILLLFIIGMEFSLKSLVAIKNTVFIGGFFQVGITILLVFLVAYFTGFDVSQATFLGFIFSLSSTAIVLKLLQERSEVNSPHGKISLAILIFQDIIVVPMMLLIPLIAGQSDNIVGSLLSLLLKTVIVVLVVWFGARLLIPKLLYEVAKTKSRELFILFVVVICFSVAWATSSIGLSLALGAFIAGLIISESEYSYQATGIIIPFREIFTSFFFVSIGMLLDLSFLITHIGIILVLLVAVIVIKTLVTAGAALLLKYPLRTALLAGLSLFQIGEFAFILSKTGMEYELLTGDVYQYFLSVSILSMAITPFIMQNAEKVTNLFVKSTLPTTLAGTRSKNATATDEEKLENLKDHIMIIGYGVNGRNVAQAAKFANIPYVIIEMNAETVRVEKAKGEPIYYGDATNEFILEHLKVYSARVAVIAISDPPATKRVITSIRSICPTVHVIVRTRFMKDMDEYHHLGANEVIPEEFETSIEIFTRMLNKYLVPQDEIEHFVQNIRSDNYEMLRPQEHASRRIAPISIPDINITSLRVQSGNSQIVGKKIMESNIRSAYGVNILAIQRNEQYITDIEPDTEIHQDDILYLTGNQEAINAFNEKIKV